MANLRKVAETLAAHGQHDLAREVARVSLQIKQAGVSYATDLMAVLFVPATKNAVFDRDVIEAIYQTFVPIKGLEEPGRGLLINNHEEAGFLTRAQEDQGLRPETLVVVGFPKGYERQTLKALAQTGKGLGFTVEPATMTTKPTFRQVFKPKPRNDKSPLSRILRDP